MKNQGNAEMSLAAGGIPPLPRFLIPPFPSISRLVSFTAVFLMVARVLARRWEML